MQATNTDGTNAAAKAARKRSKAPKLFAPLEAVTSPNVDTDAAAFYLNRSPQTLRVWSCVGGPISPVRIHRRLAWPVAEIRRLCGLDR